MIRTMLRAMLACLALGCFLALTADEADAAHPDIFYNYYVGSSMRGGVPAQLYVSPVPTPPMVGHTWITYPPMMPHEYLYHHHRKYYKYYHQGGYTTATVRYH